MSNRSKPPSYRLHRGSGQAFVQIQGKRKYLGKYGSASSRERYSRIIAELVSSPAAVAERSASGSLGDGITIVELLAAYWVFAAGHYRKNGLPTRELDNIRCALRPVKALYGGIAAAEFGPLALKAVRGAMIESGLARKVVNQRIGKIKRLFRWATSEELVAPAVWHGLQSLTGLQHGRTAARETEPIGPVDDAEVDRTLPHLPAVVADLVRFQRLVGCRPGEACNVRPGDIDRSGDVWSYEPGSHKTEHRGKQRRIFIGRRAQAILERYLDRDPESYCFAPRESEKNRKAELRTRRKTPVQPSQADRRKNRPKRRPADRYNRHSYGAAVRRACAAANGMKRPNKPKDSTDAGVAELYKARLKAFNKALRAVAWHPNQLRHSAATAIRQRFGIEAAQVCLGHAKADVTGIYAERDFGLAERVMGELG